MANDKELTIKIQADTKEASVKIASLLGEMAKELGHVQSSAEDTTKAFQSLGVKSTAEIQKIKEQAVKDFETIKNSGTATPKDIANAHSNMTRIVEQNTEKQVSFGNKITNAWKGMKAAWLEIAIVVGSLNFLRKMAMSAIEAEEAASKLKFQIEGLGISFEKVKDAVNEATQATAKYAIVQEEEVQGVLQQLIFITGDLKKSQESLNLVYDLAYQKGISVADAANIVAKGMTGNLEPLGRQFIEFRNLNEEMGKHVIQADKVAIFQAFMTERVKGSIKEMSVQKQIIQSFGKYWADWAQNVGGAALSAIRWVDDMTVGYQEALEITQKLGKMAYASVGDQQIMIVNEENLLAIKNLILDATKEKEISEKEIEKIIKDSVEEYKKEATVTKKNMEERKAGEKRISDFIDARIKKGKEASDHEKKANEERKKFTEDFYKDLANKQKAVESEILKRRIDADKDYLAGLKARMLAAEAEYKTLLGKITKLELGAKTLVESTAKDIKGVKEIGVAPETLNKQAFVENRKALDEQANSYSEYNKQLKNTEILFDRTKTQLEKGINFDDKQQIKIAIDDIESLKKSLDPEKFKESATALQEASDAIDAGKYAEAAEALKTAAANFKVEKIEAQLGVLDAVRQAFVDIGTAAKDDQTTFDGTSTKIKASVLTALTEINTLAKRLSTELATARITTETEASSSAKNFQSEIDTVEAKIKTLIDMNKKMEFEILVKGYEEALAKKAELEKATSSTHTIYTRYEGQSAPRGSNEAIGQDLNDAFQGLSEGGRIKPIKAANGKYFPGFGGGDKIPILGESGEFMSDKNTVRHWSPKMFEILKMKDTGALLNYLGANKMSQGGTTSSGTMDKLSVDLNLGGKIFPMNTTKNTGTDFAKQIKQLSILRGRYKQPY